MHGDFYRVVAVTPSAANPTTQVNLELQTPISNANGISFVTVLDSVAEVFEREAYPSNEWASRTNP